MSRICPECGSYSPPGTGVCNCGRKISVSKPIRFPLYLAALPLIFPAFLMFRAVSGSHTAASAIEVQPKLRSCVETYNTKLSDTQVLSGTARNVCGDLVKQVHLTISAVDSDGNRKAETVEIKAIEAGNSQRFERVLGGRVKSWEIASDK